MSKRDSLAQRGSRDEPEYAPALPGVGPGTPAWVPEGVGYDRIPEKVRAMIAEIIEPAYEQLVVRARDALEKTTGLTIVHLAWQEIVDQIDLARDYDKIGSHPRHHHAQPRAPDRAPSPAGLRQVQGGEFLDALAGVPPGTDAGHARAATPAGRSRLGGRWPARARTVRTRLPTTPLPMPQQETSPQQDGPPGDSPSPHEPA